MNCPLCSQEETNKLSQSKQTRVSSILSQYFLCNNCQLIFLDPIFYLSQEEELVRYQMHNNNNQDSGYIEYMSDLSQCVLAHQKNHDLGLDYGCGPSHTIEFLLPSMRLNNYDPNFYPNSDALELKYDFIVLSEVIEHLKNPLQEVLKIKKLLKNNSRLYIQTQMYNENTDFANWYYRRDPTHIVFFNKQSFEFIKKLANFKHVEFVSNKLIILQN